VTVILGWAPPFCCVSFFFLFAITFHTVTVIARFGCFCQTVAIHVDFGVDFVTAQRKSKWIATGCALAMTVYTGKCALNCDGGYGGMCHEL
jgi:hypothetical protein